MAKRASYTRADPVKFAEAFAWLKANELPAIEVVKPQALDEGTGEHRWASKEYSDKQFGDMFGIPASTAASIRMRLYGHIVARDETRAKVAAQRDWKAGVDADLAYIKQAIDAFKKVLTKKQLELFEGMID
jgi:hypothetical protein